MKKNGRFDWMRIEMLRNFRNALPMMEARTTAAERQRERTHSSFPATMRKIEREKQGIRY